MSKIKEIAGNFKPLPKGVHLAICDAVADVGIQQSKYGNRHQCWIRFEVPSERSSYSKGGQDFDEPCTLWTPYTMSLNKKANLRRDLEGWFGRSLTTDELKNGFEIFDLVGKPAQIVVIHREDEDRVHANLQSIVAVGNGQIVPEQELPSIRFDPENTDDYDNLPGFLQKRFDDRIVIEYPESAAETDEQDFHDDDIPFDHEEA